MVSWRSCGLRSLLGLVDYPCAAPPGLTSDQEAWLVAVTRDNTTLPWPPLSDSQILQLQHSVETYQQITETPNYPYHQAGKALHRLLGTYKLRHVSIPGIPTRHCLTGYVLFLQL